MKATRRQFLVASAAIVGGVLTASLQGCGGNKVTPIQADVAALLPEGAQTVGKAWTRLDSADADPATALFDGLLATGVDVTDPAALWWGILRSIRDDFAAGRTAEVKEWVLALTECRLCALTL